MKSDTFETLFTESVMEDLFPRDRADQFFEALYGDVADGAYDIQLAFVGQENSALAFRFDLVRRPDKCLACNLTYGLPQVFTRHPIINLKQLVSGIEQVLNGAARCSRWELGKTQEISQDLHVIPLTVFIEPT